MQSKIILRRVVVLMILVGIVEGFFLYSLLDQKELIRKVLSDCAVQGTTASVTDAVDLELPTRLKIPKLNLDSEIEYVGLTPSGEMATPESIRNVGWYEYGVRPGELGNAVIAGHSGWKDGKSSAFDDLHKLRVGDKIYIEDVGGTIVTFVVRAKKIYDANDNVPEVFTVIDEKSHLNLITCEGDWDYVTENYSKRLVVLTDREDAQ